IEINRKGNFRAYSSGTTRALYHQPACRAYPPSPECDNAAQLHPKRKKGRWRAPPGDETQRTSLYSEEGFRFTAIADTSLFVTPALKRFQPVKRLGPSPGVLRLVKPITGSNEVVRRYDVVRRI